jgi:hypothetical protein
MGREGEREGVRQRGRKRARARGFMDGALGTDPFLIGVSISFSGFSDVI